MGATARFDPLDALRREGTRAGQELGVFACVDVVRDGGDVVVVTEGPAQGIHQRRLARSDRAADPDPQRAVFCFCHVLNNLVVWVS